VVAVSVMAISFELGFEVMQGVQPLPFKFLNPT